MDEMNRENAREITAYGEKFDKCIEKLLKYQKRGESVYINFNGNMLYSCDITVDGAYMQVFGETKAEHDKYRKELNKRFEEEKKQEVEEAKARIPEWIERGEKLIYPERIEEWKKCVESRATGDYYGTDLDFALEVMEKLESGASLEEAKELMFSQANSGTSLNMEERILLNFSKKGPELLEYAGELSEKEKVFAEEKKRENEKLEIMNGVDIKRKLKEEIADIERQLEELKAREKNLKKMYGEKSAKLYGIETGREDK